MNLMIFCSNPIDGGTARIFYETVVGLSSKKDINVFPCIDKNNKVEIYRKIENINMLEIKPLSESGYKNKLIRIIIRLFYKIYYIFVKKKNIKKISDYIIKNNIDAVLIHNGGYVGDDLCNQVLKAAYKNRKYVKKRVYVFHNDMEKNFIRKIRYIMYDRFICKSATKLVTVSNFTRKRILNYSFINRDIKVIYNGISKYVNDSNFKFRPDSRKKNVLMIGNFMVNKGQIYFIEVANLLHKVDGSYHFTIIGNITDKEYFNLCKRKIDEYGLNLFVDIYSGINDASKYISFFDVLAVTSIYDESFGLISLEAMSNSIPVVAFSCGGIPEVVQNNKCGYIVDVKDVNDMAKKIEFINNDRNLHTMMSQRCYERFIENFSIEAMLDNYYKILNN